MVVDWFIKKCCTPLEQFHGHLHHHHLSLSCHSDHLLHHHHHLLFVVYRVFLCLLVLVATCRHYPQGHPKEYMYYQWKVLSESLQIKRRSGNIEHWVARTRYIILLQSTCFTFQFIQQGIWHLWHACFGSWLIEQEILLLKCACFAFVAYVVIIVRNKYDMYQSSIWIVRTITHRTLM